MGGPSWRRPISDSYVVLTPTHAPAPDRDALSSRRCSQYWLGREMATAVKSMQRKCRHQPNQCQSAPPEQFVCTGVARGLQECTGGQIAGQNAHSHYGVVEP